MARILLWLKEGLYRLFVNYNNRLGFSHPGNPLHEDIL